MCNYFWHENDWELLWNTIRTKGDAYKCVAYLKNAIEAKCECKRVKS